MQESSPLLLQPAAVAAEVASITALPSAVAEELESTVPGKGETNMRSSAVVEATAAGEGADLSQVAGEDLSPAPAGDNPAVAGDNPPVLDEVQVPWDGEYRMDAKSSRSEELVCWYCETQGSHLKKDCWYKQQGWRKGDPPKSWLLGMGNKNRRLDLNKSRGSGMSRAESHKK